MRHPFRLRFSDDSRPGDGSSLLELAPEPLQVRDVAERLAVLLPAADGPGRVPEWQDREDLQLGRDFEERLHLVESAEAQPVRTDAVPQAVNSMDWIARLASETANRVLSMATTMASGASAT